MGLDLLWFDGRFVLNDVARGSLPNAGIPPGCLGVPERPDSTSYGDAVQAKLLGQRDGTPDFLARRLARLEAAGSARARRRHQCGRSG